MPFGSLDMPVDNAPPAACRLRAPRSTDRHRLALLLAGVAPRYPGFGDWFDRRFDDVLLGREYGVVALVGTDPVGLALQADKGAGRRKLSTLFVHPACRGRCIGRSLMRATIVGWHRDGIEAARVTVPADDAATIAFFRASGFAPTILLPDRYGPGRSEAVLTWTPESPVPDRGGAARPQESFSSIPA
ncbi:MAG: GNAT family N-acetyltransferase [Azospirillaceae bacterium]